MGVVLGSLWCVMGCAATSDRGAKDLGPWGYTPENPIGVQDLGWSQDTLNESFYLNLLRGPAGQQVHYRRMRDCSEASAPSAPQPDPELHCYKVHYHGLGEFVILYFDPAGQDELQPPQRFKLTEQ